MSNQLVDVTMHIDEDTSHEVRETLRNHLLDMDGVAAAVYHDEKPHLMIIEYDPEVVKSTAFIQAAETHQLHAKLVGL